MKGDKKPIAFVEDTCVEPRHLAEFVPRFQQIFAKHDTVGAYYGHCSVGCLHIRPVIDLKTPRGLDQVQGHRRRDLRPGGGVSRDDLQRARRRPGAQPLSGEDVRAHHHAGLPRAEGGLRPENRLNPGQHRGQPRRDRAPALRAAYRTWEPTTRSTSPTQGGFAAAIEMCNGVGRVQEEPRGHHVPLVHGHQGRGALHARPGQCPARGALRAAAAGGVHRPADVRGHRPLPGVQGLQGRVPVQRGHGQAEVRVPAPLLRGERPAAPQPALCPHRG